VAQTPVNCDDDVHSGSVSPVSDNRGALGTLGRIERTINTEGMRVAAELAESVIAGKSTRDSAVVPARVVIGNAIVRFLVRRVRAQSDRQGVVCATNASRQPQVMRASTTNPPPPASRSAGETPVVTPAMHAEVCAIYDVALRHRLSDSTPGIVVYDSVSLALPAFALRDLVNHGLPGTGAAVPFTDSLWTAMRASHRERQPLPACFGAGKRTLRVHYDALVALYRANEDGWMAFARAFPGVRGFHIVGKPMFANDRHTEAFLYIAHAAHWLSGAADVLYLRKVNRTWEVIGRHSMLRSHQVSDGLRE
jgi:hypothetical protein